MTTTATQVNTAKCRRCGRALTAVASIARGYGRHCQTRIVAQAKAIADATPDQVASALQLIEDGAVLPLRRSVWLTVATNGVRVHRTTATACTCDAGVRGRRCYHEIAVRLLAA